MDIDLQAIQRAEFRDTKEGTFALRVATELDEPPATAKPGAPRRTGRLLNSRGGVGEKNVWFGLHDYLNDKSQNGGLVIDPGQHARFRYRVVIHPGLAASEVAKLHAEFAKSR